MITKEQLEPRVLKNIRPFLGYELLEVKYSCLLGEADLSEIANPDFYFGGEVVIQFAGTKDRLIITWDENAGWEEHFSVQTRKSSAFEPGSLQIFDASRSPIWEENIGQTFIGFEVLGFSSSPQIIVLKFPEGDILVGCGSQSNFGDGDDVIASLKKDAKLFPETVLLYREEIKNA